MTQKSKILKEHTLRQYAGWTPNSGMPQKYIHYFGDEANQDLLAAYGILSKDGIVDTTLRSKYCPNCNSASQPVQQYCMSCGFVLSLSEYSRLMDEQRKKEDQLVRIEEKNEQEIKSIGEEMENKFQQILAKIDVATLND